MGSLEIVKKTDSQTGHWSGFVKHLDRIVYKSELPFYPEYVADETLEEKPNTSSHPQLNPKRNVNSAEPKTSLSKMLGAIKIED